MNKTFFTPENLEAMRALNARIALFQHKILKEAMALDTQLQKRVADEKDWLVDYEMEAHIAFYLKASDSAYDEESDNLLVVHNEYLKGIADEDVESAWRWSGNHNEFSAWKHPMRGEHHCWWFHHLYDHTHLGWEDLLRIGRIWGDLHVYYQYENKDTKATI
ncbi:hypothetical protein JWV37_09610 [Sulfurospirillum sp. T05]|uniref:Uncharacterized protein n=1 Tax=Sulfurospirillum tamanense TaxID=2813362 RepID=A0ABS2WTQ1_9BACT|nr:hypothetical protein [Sulfurospirillum tamanensis]MBN2965036.1 hypothetical protein [Sulfurospirillum tamanensis]